MKRYLSWPPAIALLVVLNACTAGLVSAAAADRSIDPARISAETVQAIRA